MSRACRQRARTTESTPDTSMPDTVPASEPVLGARRSGWGRQTGSFQGQGDVVRRTTIRPTSLPLTMVLRWLHEPARRCHCWAAPSLSIGCWFHRLVPTVRGGTAACSRLSAACAAILDGCATACCVATTSSGRSRTDLQEMSLSPHKARQMHDLCQATDRPVFPMCGIRYAPNHGSQSTLFVARSLPLLGRRRRPRRRLRRHGRAQEPAARRRCERGRVG